MMRRITRWLAVWGGALLFFGAIGTGEQGPEKLGAHWAHLSDRTQVETLLDGLRSAQGSGAAARIMARNAGISGDAQVNFSPRASRGSSVTVGGNVATLTLDGSGVLRFEKTPTGWRVASGIVPATIASERPASAGESTSGFSVGSTFVDTPISREHGIDRLTRSWTETKLGRGLFGTPVGTASSYMVHYMQGPPYVSARYVQFVVDPTWNRVVFGDMEGWVKAYNGLNNPTSIAVDPGGRVFVGEEGNQQVRVFRLDGDGTDTQLLPLFTITGMKVPAALAINDGGTPLDPSDDYLYVADAGVGAILKFKLSATSGTLVATYDGFSNPTALAVGRWNGANNGFLYVVDHIAKRILLLEDTGMALEPVARFDGDRTSYFTALAVDHFGNVYVADNTTSRIVKLTASLEVLDVDKEDDLYAALASVEIPFGRITVDGEGTYWAGFDQLFALERWSDDSGARRRTLGLSLKDITFVPDENAGTVTGRFLLTDFGSVGVTVRTAGGDIVRAIAPSGMTSGYKEVVWDRRDDAGLLVPPGDYHYELAGVDTYTGETTKAAADLYLPLYYRESAGTDEPHLLRGSPVHWGNASATQDDQSVQYRFVGLDPAGTYAVSAEYIAPPDGATRIQDMTAEDGSQIHAPVAVTQSGTSIDFTAIPAAAIASGELMLSINRRDAGSAVVSQLILKETGRGFSSSPDLVTRPTTYSLSQNYPNPFNPSTIIRYELPQAGRVTLAVYDINGREVMRLEDGVKSAGAYEVRFDASGAHQGGLASGVYFYRLIAGTYSQTRKMLLLK